jgi:hypothetical protein
MNEHFKRILDDATTRLDTSLKDAQGAVARAKKEMTALAEFSEHLPHAFLDKFNHLMVGEYQFNPGNWTPDSAYLGVGFHRVMVNPAIQNPLVGKYRVIVLLQKMD